MKEQAYNKILDREIPYHQVHEHFGDSLELLQEVVNYGTNLIPRCFVSSKRTLPDIIILAVLLKHAVAMLDSVEINLSQGAVLASYVPLRSLFEVHLYISWVLNSDTNLRAKQYYVWDLRQRRVWANRTIPDTPENLAIQNMLKEHSFSIGLLEQKEVVEDAKKQLQSIDQILNQPDLESINSQFDKLKKRDYDVKWYFLSGVRSPREIEKKMGRLSEYTIFFANFSGVVHSTTIQKHISI